MFQRFVDEETGAQPWEAESMPTQVAEAYRTLEYLRQKQLAGKLGTSTHDFRHLERARRIVRQWEAENSVPVVEIEVQTEATPDPTAEESGAEESAEELGFFNGLAASETKPQPEEEPIAPEEPASIEPEPGRPMPEAAANVHVQTNVRTKQAFVAGIIMDERRPAPEMSQPVEDQISTLSSDHAAELQSLREGIRAARAELELLEHRLSALIQSER